MLGLVLALCPQLHSRQLNSRQLCFRALGNIVRLANPQKTKLEKTQWIFKKTLVPVQMATKLTFYPWVAPVLLVREIKNTVFESGIGKLYRVPLTYLSKEGPYVAGYIVISVSVGGAYVSGFEFLDKSSELLPQDSNANIVIVDAFNNENDPMRLGPEYLSLYHQKNYQNVHRIRVKSFAELQEKLNQIVQLHGPISLMDFVSHGAPGVAMLGKETFSQFDLRDLAPMNLFDRNASMRFFNCELGKDTTGREFSDQLARVFLPEGGRIAMANQIVGSGYMDVLLAALRELLAVEPSSFAVENAKAVQNPSMLWVAALLNMSRGRGFFDHSEDVLTNDSPRKSGVVIRSY